MKAFDMFCPQMLLAKFVANGSNGLGGVGNSKFIIFSQNLSGSWESSHLSFMSLGQTNVEICNTLCFQQNVQEVCRDSKTHHSPAAVSCCGEALRVDYRVQ